MVVPVSVCIQCIDTCTGTRVLVLQGIISGRQSDAGGQTFRFLGFLLSASKHPWTRLFPRTRVSTCTGIAKYARAPIMHYAHMPTIPRALPASLVSVIQVMSFIHYCSPFVAAIPTNQPTNQPTRKVVILKTLL